MGKKQDVLVMGMAGVAVDAAQVLNDAAIAALVADLERVGVTGIPSAPEVEEIIETVENTAPEIGEAVVEAAVADITVQEHYEAQPGDAEKAAEAKEAAKAKVKAERDAARAAKKAEKEKAAAEAKAKREAEAAAKKAAREAKKAEEGAKPKEPRVYFADKADRIKHRLGEQLGDFMTWEVADASLDADALRAKQEANFATVKAMNKKVKNRASLLLDYCSGKRESLNNVIATVFKVLAKDGTVTTGDKGNVITALLARPYSMSAARAMGNNTVSLLKTMKVLIPGAKDQEYVGNPNSLILQMVNGKLGLAT